MSNSKVQLTKEGQDVYPVTVADAVAGLADLANIRAGAAAGATAYQKPTNGIPEADLSSDIQNKLNSAGAFVAIYGETSFDEIYNAYIAGKIVFVKRVFPDSSPVVMLTPLTYISENYADFRRAMSDDRFWDIYYVSRDGGVTTWDAGEYYIPTTLSGFSSDPSHRLVTDAEKASWNSKYTKPSTGIPASDLATGVIPDVPTDVVRYISQSLTDAQKRQARDNIDAKRITTLVINRTWTYAQYQVYAHNGNQQSWTTTAEYANQISKGDIFTIKATISDRGNCEAYIFVQAVSEPPYTGNSIPAKCLIASSNKITQDVTALSDLTDDATHRLVTDAEKAAWDAKYAKPSGGIPKTDLASAVQTSLGLADTAVQPEVGKGLFSGNYNDLSNKPTIPTVEALTTSEIDTIWSSN